MQYPVGDRLLGDVRYRQNSRDIYRVRRFHHVYLKADVTAPFFSGQLDKAGENPFGVLSGKGGPLWSV